LTYNGAPVTRRERPMEFKTMLQKLRKAAGLSQSQLAERTRLPLRSIQNWEIGHRIPKATALLALANALEVDVGALIQALNSPKKGGK
jgi:transcriptional regulator with XRE-family HTH domain